MDRYVLSDRGIKQAIKEGLLKFDPVLTDEQIQPASVDLFFEKLGDYEEIGHISLNKILKADTLSKGYVHDVITTQSVYIEPSIISAVELRSSLRRLGCYVYIPTLLGGFGLGTMDDGFKAGIEVVNPSSIDIKLHKGDKIAQVMFTYDAPSKEEMENEDVFFIKDKEEYKKFLELDRGYMIKSTERARKLANKGYFSVSTGENFIKGFLKVHASKEAFVFKEDLEVEFGNTKNLESLLEPVSLPYKLKPKEHLVVNTRENLDLSDKIGIQFYNVPLPVNSKEFFSNRFSYDKDLRRISDGWVDPGYKGAFSRQPKTYYDKGFTIKEGDVLGYGLLVYFPNGVERKYGSEGLNSHYQNADKTHLG